MLRIERGLIGALVGLIVLGASPNSEEKSKHDQRTIGEVNGTLRSSANPPANITLDREKPCNAGNEDRSTDLCAQWKAADAASDSADAAWLFGGVGSIIGALTLLAASAAALFAKRAADHTKSAAHHAETSNTLNTISAERQDRAYLAVDPGGINRTKSNRAVGDIVIRNVGKIPAKNVMSFVRLKTMRSTNVGALDWPSDGVIADRTIQPGGEMRRSSTGTTAIKNIDDPAVHIFVWGIIRYDDGFGRPRFTRFCHRYPGAWTTRIERPRTDLTKSRARSLLTAMLESPYADELIPARFARHQNVHNDAE
ncbi:hypothetical protein [Sphingopyxis sp.]|jgi:hypothetical protein|uniref:hypothetical protein n=1 Tax=Sphingopyxis sp. TaxID=1908224 RepID=UPI0025FF1674|nr:hypothetical protein [Sphingopyxis sp.]MBK6414183.1 hypothetical protein [Sphingopyxis sp.]